MIKRILFILTLILLAAAAYTYYNHWKSVRTSNEMVLYGNVDVRLVDIGFRVPGQVDKLYFEEGDVVKAGTLLTNLDKSPYNSQVTQASANIEAIKANLINADLLLKRREMLLSSKGVSQEDVDNAKANKNALQANLAAAEAALSIAKDNLKYTDAFAPTDGTILTRVREPGSVVRESDPIYTLSITSPVWIRAFVTEPQLGNIYYGMPVDIYTDTAGAKVYSGKIGFISPVAEFTPKTVETTQLRTDLVYRLRIYADNPDKVLKQGMPVTVRLHQKDSDKKESK